MNSAGSLRSDYSGRRAVSSTSTQSESTALLLPGGVESSVAGVRKRRAVGRDVTAVSASRGDAASFDMLTVIVRIVGI
jgi:hypothetical protein